MTLACSTCKIVKNLDDFHKNGKSKSGRCYQCKDCQLKYSREHRSKNRKQYNDSVKKWRESNSEQYGEKIKAWKENNRESHLKVMRGCYYSRKYGPEFGPLLLQIKDLTDKLKEQEKEDNEKEIKASDSTKTV